MSDAYCEWLAFLRRIDLPWCVVVAQPGREKAVQAELAAAGWSTYLPMQTCWLGDRAKRRRVNRPLFARYLFAVCNPGGDLALRNKTEIDGLVKVVRPPEGGTPVAPRRHRSALRIDLLARLMVLEARHGFDLTYEKPKPPKRALVCGQAVAVRAGVLRGVEALILKVLSEREVVIKLPAPMLGRDEATVHSADLEAA